MLGHVNEAQASNPHFWKFGKRVQNVLTDFVILCTNIEVVSSVSIQLVTIEGLKFFVFVHLVFLTLLFFVLDGCDCVYDRPILLCPLFIGAGYSLVQVDNDLR